MKPLSVLFVVALVSAIVAMSAGKRVSFAGHKVVDVVIDNQQQIDFLTSLPEETDGVTGVDVWTNDGVLRMGVNRLRLSPAGFKSLMSRNDFLTTVITDDIELRMQHISAMDKKHLAQLDSMPVNSAVMDPTDKWFYTWHSPAEIAEKLQQLSAANPSFIEFFPSIVTSYEGRNITAVRINHNSKSPIRRTVVWQAGTHAREWIGESTVLWCLGVIAENPDVIPDGTELVIIPVYNPDGYQYSIDSNRYWRKNRRVNKDGTYGVDQNRNWDVNFGGSGASKSPSSDIYCGTAAFSEVETVGVSKWVMGLSENVSAVIDFHSNAALILRPWAWTQSSIPKADESRMAAFSSKMAKLIKSVHGTEYQAITGHDLYVSSGTAGDWYYKAGLKTDYVIELAGDDFVVPVSDVQKQGEEMWPALLYYITDV